MLATSGDDGSARLWDVATRHQIGPTMQCWHVPGRPGAVMRPAYPAWSRGYSWAVSGRVGKDRPGSGGQGWLEN